MTKRESSEAPGNSWHSEAPTDRGLFLCPRFARATPTRVHIKLLKHASIARSYPPALHASPANRWQWHVKAASGLVSIQEVLRDLPRISLPRPLAELKRILGS